MLKKNIITKILLSSLMAPSLLASAIPVYANPTDKSVGEDKQKFTSQSVSDDESDATDMASFTDKVLSLSPLNLTKITATPNNSIPFVTSLETTTNKIPSYIDPLDFTNTPLPIDVSSLNNLTHFTSLPPLNKLPSCGSVRQDSKITQSEQSNSNKPEEKCGPSVKGKVLDLSLISYDDIPSYYNEITNILFKKSEYGINTVKFSYKQLYARAVNLKYNESKEEYVNKILEYIKSEYVSITIEFDHILPIAPDPYNPDGFIDMSNIYSEFISERGIKIKCDSVLVYTNPKFKIIDWITEVNKTVLEPLSQKPYTGEILKCIFNAYDNDSPYSKCSHKCELKNAIFINLYEGQDINEDKLIIKCALNRNYGIIPSIEVNKILNPIIAKTGYGNSKLEKHLLANVALHIQDIDTDDLTIQRQFELVNKKTTEAVRTLRKMNGKQFFNLSPVAIYRTRPNIETIVLTGEDLCRICPHHTYISDNPHKLQEIFTNKINALSINEINIVVLNITPAGVQEFFVNDSYDDEYSKETYSYRFTNQDALEKFLDIFAHTKITFKFHSLTLGFGERYNQGQRESYLNEISNTLIKRAISQGEPLKYLYLSGISSISTDEIINLIPEEAKKIITPDTIIIADISEGYKNDTKIIDLGKHLNERFGCRDRIICKPFDLKKIYH